MTLRCLCVGAGYFSRFHLDAWKRMPEVEVVGLVDLETSRAAQMAQEFSIDRTYTDLSQAIDELKPDFVDVITRPETRHAVVQLVAARGLPMICQKPLAPNFAESFAIVETAARAGVRLMVHENFRFQPWYREIKRLLDEGVVGDRLHSIDVRTRTGDGWGPDAYLARQPYFRDMPRLLLHETGVHFIDTFRYLAGDVIDVFARLRRLNDVIQGEDAGWLQLRFNGGAIATWDANRFNESTADDPRYTFGATTVETNGGSIRLYDDGRMTLHPLGKAERDHEYAHEKRGFGGDCVYFTQRHFVDRLRSGEPFETDGREYLKTLSILEAAYRSAQEDRPIRITASAQQEAATFIDLSLPVDANLRGANVEPAKTIEKDGWNATTLTLYSHCGTHMDAPRHFVPGAASIDQQALSTCCGPARVLNLAPAAPRELITVEHLKPWLDSIVPGDRLLFRTDWYKRFGTAAYRDELPRISLDLARWLVERQVAMIGVEPPSVADVNNMQELTDVHQTLFRGNVLIVEGLAYLDRIQGEFCDFIALPMRVTGGDGSPVRAIAIERRFVR